MSRQMTEQPLVTEKQPMPKADPAVDIPAGTKKQVMAEPVHGQAAATVVVLAEARPGGARGAARHPRGGDGRVGVAATGGRGSSMKKPTKKPKAGQPEPTTQLGYPLDQVASALQKSIRAGDLEGATYWGLLLFKKSPTYTWKRVLITASEDVGLAAPEVVAQVAALNWAWTSAKDGAWYASPHPLTLAIVLLARAPKDTTIEDLQSLQLALIKAKVRRPMPEYAIDGHTKLGRERGATWDRWYAARHVTFGIPVNEYTRRLWTMKPEWRPAELQDESSPPQPGESPA